MSRPSVVEARVLAELDPQSDTNVTLLAAHLGYTRRSVSSALYRLRAKGLAVVGWGEATRAFTWHRAP
jgi:DNA-binding MarR family transcriptional regulator